MDELLEVIEELKRAYKASGVESVKIELDGGDTKCILIDKQKYALENMQKKPLTNGDWFRGLSDEELARQSNISCLVGKGKFVTLHKVFPDICKQNCDEHGFSCGHCLMAWLRAEHKE